MAALTVSDIIPNQEYAPKRSEFKRRIGAMKRDRRMAVGPFVTFYFECRDTMWLQVQEMLYIEKGSAEQVPDELEAYNPLIPNGSELIATFMIEIDDPVRRARVLTTLGGIEESAFLRIGGETIAGVPEEDQARTNAEGKASSVQFVRFPFTARQIAMFRETEQTVVLGFTHPNYGHMAVMSPPVRAALAKDFS